MKGCCPDGSLPALAESDAGRLLTGSTIELEESVKAYYSAPEDASRGGVIVVYDVFGFEGGRIKSVCDTLAAAGFATVMPDIFGDADTIDNHGGLAALGAGEEDVTAWIKSNGPSKFVPIMERCAEFLKSKRCGKVAGVGLCWGAYPVFKAAELGLVSVGMAAHPSLHVGAFYGEPEVAEFAAKTGKCPMLLAPTQTDSDEQYGESGCVTLAVRANGFECVSKRFGDMAHGFTARGDVGDPAVKRDVAALMELTVGFLAKHMAA